VTARLEAFRTEVRDWLSVNAPKDWRAADTHLKFVESQKEWFRKLVDGGYAVPHWPAQWLGGGRSLAEQKVIYEELARADAPRLLLSFISTYHAYSTIVECGSAEQQARYLPRILEGETWCQGFSEPGAGSDLAALKCKAELRKDVYIVNGQKVWSTMAQYADKCLLLVRTSSDGVKQAGITFLLMDMKAPGVTVRPIHQIQGDEEFAEIFLDNVEVPVNERVGEEGKGWAVAQATLASERGLTLMELSYRMRGAMGRIAKLVLEGARSQDAGVLRDIGRLLTKVDTACAIADQFLENRMNGIERIGDASIVKLTYSRVLRDYAALGVRLGGIGEQYQNPITFGDLNTGNWMADFMNSYAWTIAGGSDEVQVNTGFFDDANQARNVALLKPHRTGPLRRIILTQSHADHFGGVPAFEEAGTTVIGGPGFNEAWGDMNRLQPFFGPRSKKLWGSTLKRGAVPKPAPDVQSDILVDRTYGFEQGGRTFELISAPEGETVDNLIVWMPKEKIAFTGNLVGPVWLSMPFLVTLRGDKPRLVWNYLKSLEKLRALGVEMIITGHGEPITGAAQIRADIDKMHAAVSWVRDYTLDGMNAGKTVHELMRNVALPADLKIGEFHGKVSWAVKTIWEEYAGWLHYEDGTTELYGVPRSSVNADLAELAGIDALVYRAHVHVESGCPLEAIHLLDIALGATPGHVDALKIKKAAHEHLLIASGGGNLSETMWLKSEIAAIDAAIGTS
jgi:alkylation response protein AidB-like acyl-CoA dehydrogenase